MVAEGLADCCQFAAPAAETAVGRVVGQELELELELGLEAVE
jgi:hypothetical protein